MANPALFLYDTRGVVDRLKELPALAALIPSPAVEGLVSNVFPGARKSQRQIYRVLANRHYPHSDELLATTDTVIAAGFNPRHIRTSSADQFASVVSEIQVAADLVDCGFTIVSPAEANKRIPEFVAYRGDHSFAIEVYTPRGWDGLTELPNAIRERLENVDVGLDFVYSIEVEQLERFDRTTGQLIYADPVGLARQLDIGRRRAVGVAVSGCLERQFGEGATDTQAEWASEGLNLRVSARVERVRASRESLPNRSGWISHLGLSGYSPEAMFGQMMNRRMRAKAGRRQGCRSQIARSSVLVVDLARSDLSPHLGPGPYRKHFLAALRNAVSQEVDLGYDLILIGSPSSKTGDFVVEFVATEAGVAASDRRLSTILAES